MTNNGMYRKINLNFGAFDIPNLTSVVYGK